MGKFYHQKLIRDKIPQIIKANDGKCEIRVMNKDEFKKELRKKLIEESKEVKEAEKDELVKELSDVLEVIKSIAQSENISFNLIEEKRKERKKKRGGFKKRLFLIWSSNPKDK